ncbi:MAG: VCBS repeat-containing protein [Planctomycetales bacterium]|nr:VCBS repeat-containing protein [Planctomycetales bacterium]
MRHACALAKSLFAYGCVAALLSTAANAADAIEPHFQPETIDADVAIGYGLAVGHVNDDGRPDILLADKSEFVWYENPGQRGAAWPRHVMARNLTPRDNVCLAARDLNGDGLVEVAVGANWNPGETTDTAKSGAVFYLRRPADPRQLWQPVAVEPYDPTVHRMHWVRWGPEDYRLMVLPLHGRGNQNGAGAVVRLSAYAIDLQTGKVDSHSIVMEQMHMTHNFDVVSLGPVETAQDSTEGLLVAGKEALRMVTPISNDVVVAAVPDRGAGEVRAASVTGRLENLVSIEPMHGTELVFYRKQADGQWQRRVLDDTYQQGHALAIGDLLGLGRDQIVAGWRNPNADNRVGVRLYVPDEHGDVWQRHTIDDNTMACEDLRLADLDGDGRLDVVAAGRATNNLVVYWNE